MPKISYALKEITSFKSYCNPNPIDLHSIIGIYYRYLILQNFDQGLQSCIVINPFYGSMQTR